MASVGFQEPEKPQKSSINFSLPIDSVDEGDGDLTQRIEEFKYHNPEEVEELKRCIAEVLVEAEKTAQERLDRKAVRRGYTLQSHTADNSIYFFYFHSLSPSRTHACRVRICGRKISMRL